MKEYNMPVFGITNMPKQEFKPIQFDLSTQKLEANVVNLYSLIIDKPWYYYDDYEIVYMSENLDSVIEAAKHVYAQNTIEMVDGTIGILDENCGTEPIQIEVPVSEIKSYMKDHPSFVIAKNICEETVKIYVSKAVKVQDGYFTIQEQITPGRYENWDDEHYLDY